MAAARKKKGGQDRKLVTPDGVPLNIVIADVGERAAALAIDLGIMFAAFVALVLISIFLLAPAMKELAFIFFLIVFFFIRSFYFIFFEIRWHGSTPGKRALGLRVIERNGGRLQPEAVFARNLMREVEVYIPMSIYFTYTDIGIEAIWLVLNSIWIGAFVLLPLFNRDRLRAGDMVGGTMVIRAPAVELLDDVIDSSGPERGSEEKQAAKFRFHAEQLGIYGVHELQVLERVLRQEGPDIRQVHETVARQIATKVGWRGESHLADPTGFLRDFYAAQRAKLEGGLLFGQRKADKFDNGQVQTNAAGDEPQ